MRTATADTRKRLRAADEVSPQSDPGQQCNPVTNRPHRGGRRRLSITYDDFVGEPTETMRILAHMKNDAHSWRTLAEGVNHHMTDGKVSHTLVRRVALGHCKSPRIDYALGIRQAPPPVEVTPCPDCGKVHKQIKACRSSRKRGKRRFAFSLTDEEFSRAHAVIDSHPGGRVAWLLEHLQE